LKHRPTMANALNSTTTVLPLAQPSDICFLLDRPFAAAAQECEDPIGVPSGLHNRVWLSLGGLAQARTKEEVRRDRQSAVPRRRILGSAAWRSSSRDGRCRSAQGTLDPWLCVLAFRPVCLYRSRIRLQKNSGQGDHSPPDRSYPFHTTVGRLPWGEPSRRVCGIPSKARPCGAVHVRCAYASNYPACSRRRCYVGNSKARAMYTAIWSRVTYHAGR